MKERVFPQISLPLSNATGVDDLPDAVIASRPNLHAAIILAIEVSGLQDEQLAEFLGTSPGNFSKYRSGKYQWPINKLLPLMKFLGNDIILRWLALSQGYNLVKMKSTLEEENEYLRQQLAERNREIEVIERFVKQTR